MSEFLKFAYELLSQVVYNIVTWLVAFLKLFITGWAEYFLIFRTYFPTLEVFAKILSVILMIILFAIPVLLVIILVRHMILRHQLKADKTDNAALNRTSEQAGPFSDGREEQHSGAEGQCHGRHQADSLRWGVCPDR